MNIFIVDHNPILAAQDLCDKHVVKMIVESAQMLSTAHRVLDEGILSKEFDDNLYKSTHKNHPCSIWVRESYENYSWLYEHLDALIDEYHYRYPGKTHKTSRLLQYLRAFPKNLKTSSNTKMEYAVAIPEESFVKITGDTVKDYRNYYIYKSTRIKMFWTNRPPPVWFKTKRASLL